MKDSNPEFMCMVSNIGDEWAHQFPEKWPKFNPPPFTIPTDVTRAEVEALRNEIKELKKLLVAAKEFDTKTGQPDCQMDEKVRLIRAIAKLLGVEIGDVLPTQP